MTALDQSNSGDPLRCTHFLSSVRLEQGGVDRAVLDLCRVSSEHGIQITLVTCDATDVPQPWREPDATNPRTVVIDPPQGKLGGLTASATQTLQEILADTDVLHLHTTWDPTNAKVAKLARQLAVPYILTVHGMLDDWCMTHKPIKKRLYMALVARRMLEQAASVHCTAQGEMDQAAKWFPNGKPVILPCVFDIEPFVNLPGDQPARAAFSSFADDEPNVLFLSRIHPKKGVELLIEAAAILRKQHVPINVLIAGPHEPPGYLEQLEAMVQRLGLSESVHFLGMVRGELKVSLYQACDLFVLPTYQENFGLVLPEAMACRTPVITTRGVDIWPELEQGGALIVDGTAEAMAEAIKQSLSDREALESRGEQGRQFIFDWLDPTKLAARYEDVYRQAINQISPSA